MAPTTAIASGVTARFRGGARAWWFAAAWLGVVALIAAAADILPFVGDPYLANPRIANADFSAEHWLGTDRLGRDTLARLVFGARTSLFVGMLTVLVCFVVGGLVGILAGYRRKWVDWIVLLGTDALMSIPGMVIAIAIVAFLGQHTINIVLALSVIVLPGVIRVARSNALAVSQREYVSAARMAGAGDLRIVFKEVLPNVMSPLLSLALILLGLIVLAEGSLSFVGLGVPPPEPTWGGMVAEGRSVLDTNPKLSLIPAVALFTTVISLNTVGNRVRSALDSRGGAL
jgi:peptide/nickel transport system permease protein